MGTEPFGGTSREERDGLTGLLSLQGFRSIVDAALAAGHTGGQAGTSRAVVFFNFENFKLYNQHFGLAAGDTLILHLADSIRDAFPSGVVARFGPDQVVVFERADVVHEAVRRVRADFRHEHKDTSIWLRAGYYVLEDGVDASMACDHAKVACDELRGRRDVYLREYDDDLKHEIVWRRYVLDHFDEALEKGWIHAWCMPIVRVATGETCDVEAMARWIDPDTGMVAPYEFIPVLEDARLIHKLDLAIIKDVCRTCAELRSAGLPFIPSSVNISRLDFELCDIVEEVTRIVDGYELPHDLVSIEITESALTGNQEFLRTEVDRFRERGFEVWMDDFGSGYSSLNVLKDYAFDLVKVDMALVRDIGDSEQARIMMAKVIDMVKELGLKTLVEGVETREQYDFLRSLGCGRAQGYYFGRPAPMPESIIGLANATHPDVEVLQKRDFYEEVGRVNLMRPDPHASVTGHYLPSDAAACIIRRRNGRYEYLNTNDLYAKFLQDAGIGTTEDSERMLNEVGSDRHDDFVQALDRCTRTGEWEHYVIELGERALRVRVRLVSQLEEFDAVAALCVVERLRHA